MTPHERYLLKKHLRDNCGDIQVEHELEVYRNKGKWIVEASDQDMVNLLYSNGSFYLYSSEYVALLEELLVEQLTKTQQS